MWENKLLLDFPMKVLSVLLQCKRLPLRRADLSLLELARLSCLKRIWLFCRVQFSEDLVIATPDIHNFALGPDSEFIVLASDGLWDYMSRFFKTNISFVGLRWLTIRLFVLNVCRMG